MLKQIDNVGRIVIPIGMRRKLNIDKECDVDIELLTNEKTTQIIIKPIVQRCSLCGSTKDSKVISAQNICSNCIKNLKKEL